MLMTSDAKGVSNQLLWIAKEEKQQPHRRRNQNHYEQPNIIAALDLHDRYRSGPGLPGLLAVTVKRPLSFVDELKSS